MENLWQYTDGYKLSHHIQYPQDTKVVYSNFTPRNFKHANGVEKFVVYGIKNLITRLHIKWQIFIESNWDDIEDEMRDFLESYAPSPHNELLIERWKQLHCEQKLPLKIMALDEMTEVGPGVPILTIHNTKPEYFWLVNYLETYISAELWKPATCASIANQYRKVFDEYAELTCENNLHVDYQGHDFSMRGMSSVDDSMNCGRAHLKYFKGTDSLLAVDGNAASCVATEHSVMCANIFYNMHKDPELSQSEAETQFIRKLITETYPSGIVSIVSDTFDFWDTITNKAKALKDDILQRDGVTVFRPDSNDPVDVICGKHFVIDADDPNVKDANAWAFSRYDYDSHNYDDLFTELMNSALHNNNLVEGSEPGALYIKFEGSLYSIDYHAEYYPEFEFDAYIKKITPVSEVSAEHKGALQCLWDEFGGTVNSKGYKVLNPKVGLIYGDSITLQRQKQILEKMKQKGFASSNIVLGIGSYTYQCITRDTFGCAIKATGILVGDELTEIPLYKAPKGDASKHSAKGFMKVVDIDGSPSLVDNISFAESQNAEDNMLKEIEWDYYYYV